MRDASGRAVLRTAGLSAKDSVGRRMQDGVAVAGMTLTARAEERSVVRSAMGLKLHSCSGLYERGVPRATVTVSTLSTYRRGEHFRKAITAAAASGEAAGAGRQAFTDGPVAARVDSAAGSVCTPREANGTERTVSLVSSPPAGRVEGEDDLRRVSFGRTAPVTPEPSLRRHYYLHGEGAINNAHRFRFLHEYEPSSVHHSITPLVTPMCDYLTRWLGHL